MVAKNECWYSRKAHYIVPFPNATQARELILFNTEDTSFINRSSKYTKMSIDKLLEQQIYMIDYQTLKK